MSSIPVPPISSNFLLGPGSHDVPEKDKLEYMAMPTEMSTFDVDSKIYEWDPTTDLSQCKQFLENIYTQLGDYKVTDDNLLFKVKGLNADNKAYLNALLSEGEVSAVITQEDRTVNIQESIFTGIWRVTVIDSNKNLLADYVEAGDIPKILVDKNQEKSNKVLFDSALLPENVINAPSILTELEDKKREYSTLSKAQLAETLVNPIEAINLTLLPHTEEDLAAINNILGLGDTVILSRGYGNCRITSTGVSSIWWVKYFNSTDNEILSTIEVVGMPIVACAAQEDIESSVVRLKEFSDEL